MATDPAYLHTMSINLSRIMDEVGVNNTVIKQRRRQFLFEEQLFSVFHRLNGKCTTVYHFGSQIEGTTTYGLKSDIDTLFCFNDINVIQNWSDWQQGQCNILMVQDMTAPGYCRLQELRSDLPMYAEEYSTCGSRRMTVLENSVLNTPAAGSREVRNGPALSTRGSDGLKDLDFVRAVQCKQWPTQAEGFLTRTRRYGWPSQRLLQKAVKHGVFLVPVGYKLSPTEPLEWRISASLAERCLMFSLNTVQLKCYVVLKMLVKTFVEPCVRKSISSYHCKTALLYNVENTEPEFWRDENLLQCVTHCLTTLLTWVTDGFCPHFFIAEANLFAGKVTAENRNTIQSLLKDLIKDNCRAILHVDIDDLGHNLQAKLSTEPSVVPILVSEQNALRAGEIEFNRLTKINVITKSIFIINNQHTNTATVTRSVYRNIIMCYERIKHSEKHERRATEVTIEILSRWLGSLLASYSLFNKMGVPCMAIKLLRIGVSIDIATVLKLASVLYINGDFRKAEKLLRRTENHVSRNTISVCGCNLKLVTVLATQLKRKIIHRYLSTKRGDKASDMIFAHCVSFTPQEIHCTPPELQKEFFKSVGDDFQHRDPKEDKWFDLAVVDSLPYLYFLQHMTYRQLGYRALQKQSLHNLGYCLRDDHDFKHPETGWNILGQCLELEQDTESAMACYRTSLEIRPRNSAANWHIAVLCFNVIKPYI